MCKLRKMAYQRPIIVGYHARFLLNSSDLQGVLTSEELVPLECYASSAVMI